MFHTHRYFYNKHIVINLCLSLENLNLLTFAIFILFVYLIALKDDLRQWCNRYKMFNVLYYLFKVFNVFNVSFHRKTRSGKSTKSSRKITPDSRSKLWRSTPTTLRSATTRRPSWTRTEKRSESRKLMEVHGTKPEVTLPARMRRNTIRHPLPQVWLEKNFCLYNSFHVYIFGMGLIFLLKLNLLLVWRAVFQEFWSH